MSHTENRRRNRFDLSSSGVDEALQGFTSDPYGGGFPQGYGLRIPPVLPGGPVSPALRPRYLFCLATRTMTKRTRLLGIRQGLTIGINFLASTPERPLELNVTTPGFRFVDGNVSWHLVSEPNTRPRNQKPSTDANNWSFLWSDGPAMLYQTFANTTVNPTTGAPLIYNLGLTAYTPPNISSGWKPLYGNLGKFYDIRFPANADLSLEMKLDINRNERVSLYASVLQTDPAFPPRQVNVGSPPPLGTPPEEAFISSFSGGGEGANNGPIYWRIFGSLIFEDEFR